MSLRVFSLLRHGYWRPNISALCRYKATASTAQTIDSPDVKPYSEIPGPIGLPFVGTMFETSKHMDTFYKLLNERFDKYGPIYKERLGNRDMVFLKDVDAVAEFLRQDVKYPSRLQLDHWLDYRKKKEINSGLLLSEGEQWHSLRRVVDQHMMKIRTVESYTGEFNTVVEDFLERLGRIRTQDNEIPDLHNELYNWSLESIGSILYEKRLGCLDDNRSQEIQDFIQSAHDIFEATSKIFFLPVSLAKILMPGTYQKHDQAWDTLFRIGHRIIDERIQAIQDQPNEGESAGILTHFLKEETMKDVYANIMELMGAAVDMTSITTSLVIYEVARNPHVQEAVLEEVNRVVPPGEQPQPEHVKEMHYMKAVIKEILRLFPIATTVIRKVQLDINLLGYNIPEGKYIWVDQLGVGRLEELYEDPDTFRPERWLRDQRTTKPHPFAWLPFGFGTRMCVGRRVAELEIQLLVSQLVRQFRLEPVSMEPVEMITNLLLLPKDPIRVRAFERK